MTYCFRFYHCNKNYITPVIISVEFLLHKIPDN